MKFRTNHPSILVLSALFGVALSVAPFSHAAAAPLQLAPAAQRAQVRTQKELDAALKNTAQIRDIQLTGAGPFSLKLSAEHGAPVGSFLNIAAAPGVEPVLSVCELNGVSRVRISGMRLEGVRMNVVGGQEVTISGNVFRGGKGALVAERVSSLLVEGNRIGTPSEGPSGNGIRLTRCVGARVLGNVVRHAVSSGSGECITLSGCESVEIAFNLVSDRENISSNIGGEGIDVKGSRFVEVHDNVVRGNPRRPGIYIDSYDGTNHRCVFSTTSCIPVCRGLW